MDEKNIIAQDGGYTSRKFWFAIISLVMIIVASKICAVAVLSEVVTGIIAVAGIYITGNVVQKWRATTIETAKINQPQPQVKKFVKPTVKTEDDMRG
jgi:hypothetical protein